VHVQPGQGAGTVLHVPCTELLQLLLLLLLLLSGPLVAHADTSDSAQQPLLPSYSCMYLLFSLADQIAAFNAC
jgi:hypothetical protein